MVSSRRLFSIFAISSGIMLLGCEQKNLISPMIVQQTPEPPPRFMLCQADPNRPTDCLLVTGQARWTLSGANNCHGYVIYAVLNQQILSTGEPLQEHPTFGEPGPIYSNDNFIRVCLETEAQALFHLPNSKDHSVVILSPGHYAYTTPSTNGSIYTTDQPLNFSRACDYEYYAVLRDVNISAPVKNGDTYTFNLQNVPSVVTQTTWGIPAGFETVGISSPSQLVIRPAAGSNVSGQTHSVSASLYTEATLGHCTYGQRGVNNFECANNRVPSRQTTFTIPPEIPPPVICSGTLDGGALSTVNSVTYGTHQVVMAGTIPLTWVRTSGDGTWNVTENGHNVSITLSSSGGTTFHVYGGGGCDMNFTFYPHF